MELSLVSWQMASLLIQAEVTDADLFELHLNNKKSEFESQISA